MSIDITLSLNLSPYTLEGWRVCSDATFSDHRHIEFSLPLLTIATIEVLNLARANWQQFREILDRQLFWDPKYITKWWLDRAVLGLERCVQRALRLVCPLCRGPRQPDKSFYWEGEVEGLRRSARRAWRTYSRDQNKVTWTAYLECRWVLCYELEWTGAVFP